MKPVDAKFEMEIQIIKRLHSDLIASFGITKQFDNIFVKCDNNIPMDQYSQLKDEFRNQAYLGIEEVKALNTVKNINPVHQSNPGVAKIIDEGLKRGKNRDNEREHLSLEARTSLVDYFRELNSFWNISSSRKQLLTILKVNIEEDKTESRGESENTTPTPFFDKRPEFRKHRSGSNYSIGSDKGNRGLDSTPKLEK